MDSRLGPFLVTGASGYLGSSVVHRLRSQGATVVGLSRGHDVDMSCDLLDVKQVYEVISKVRPHIIVHCAAAVPKTDGGYDDVAASADSTQMVHNLLVAGAARIVFASSMTVYSPLQTMPVVEAVTAPQSAYGHGKLEAERLLLGRSDVTAVVLRLPGLFGPPRRGGLVFNVCLALANKELPPLPTAPVLWAGMHVEDAVEIVARSVMKFPDRSTVMNVGYPGIISVSLLVHNLAGMLNCNPSYDIRHPDFEMDLGILADYFGLPRYSLQDRLLEMVEYAKFQANPDHPVGFGVLDEKAELQAYPKNQSMTRDEVICETGERNQ